MLGQDILFDKDIDVTNLIFNLQSCSVEKYEFQSMFCINFDHTYSGINQYTNPSYLAGFDPIYSGINQDTNPSYLSGLPMGTMTMSVSDGYTSQYTNPSYLAGLPLGTTTMSVSDNHTSQYTNPSYLAGLPLGSVTMSVLDGHTSQNTNPSYFIGSSSHTVGGYTIQYINHNYFVDTVNLISHYKPTEQSCTKEYSLHCDYHEHITKIDELCSQTICKRPVSY